MSRSQQEKDYRMLMRYLVPGLGVMISLMIVIMAFVWFPEESMAARGYLRNMFVDEEYVGDPYEGAYAYESMLPERITLKEDLEVEVSESRVISRFRGETVTVTCTIFAGQDTKILAEDKQEFGALLVAEYQAPKQLREGECKDRSRIYLSRMYYSTTG
jgi:hypothetical protein